MENIEVRSETIDGVSIILNTIDGLGRNAAENVVGADVLGCVHMDIGGVRLSKGFLLQSKMSGSDNLRFRRAAPDPPGVLDASHVFSRGPLDSLDSGRTFPMGDVSGTVSLSKPSARLRKQCEDMLRLTPASFVMVIDELQICVVSAAAIHARRTNPSSKRGDLGTKTLSDFFANVTDCFIGDERLGSATQADLVAQASLLNVPTVISLRVTDELAIRDSTDAEVDW